MQPIRSRVHRSPQTYRRLVLTILKESDKGRIEPDRLVSEGGAHRDAVRYVITDLESRGIGKTEGGSLLLEPDRRMDLALLLLSLGVPLEDLASQLHWRDFERFAARVFAENGYHVETHLLMKRPRMEVDVVAFRHGRALVLDCKHWKRIPSPSTVRALVAGQIRRASALAQGWARGRGIDWIVPAIVTLREPSEIVVDGVPVIPVQKLQSFILEMDSFLDRILLLEV